MAIETEVTVTLAAVDVGDDYNVEVTVTDPLSRGSATISLTWAQAVRFADELLGAVGDATVAVREDSRPGVLHGFETPPLSEWERAEVARFGIHPEDVR